MRAMQRGIGWCVAVLGRAARLFGLLPVVAGLVSAVLVAGCSSSIRTPLPDIGPAASTSLSQKQRDEAVEELNRLRATHEKDAVRSIEESR